MRQLMMIVILSILCPAAAAAAPLHFVYKGAGCNGLAELPMYEAFLGRKVDGVTDFVDWTTTWPRAVSGTHWLLGCWRGKVSNIDLSVPLTVRENSGSPLHDVASGAYNTYFTQIAEDLVKQDFPNAFVRLGIEFNGGWYPWSAKNSPQLWAEGFRQAVMAMRAVKGAHFKFVWNPSTGMGQVWPDAAYPGDDVVDVIASDVYNASWNSARGDNREPGLWSAVYNDPWWVKSVVAFAARHNKPYAFPEWGTGERADRHGGGDDPTFMAHMIPIIQGATFESYWDFNAGDYNSAMTDGTHPLSAAIFSRAFSNPGSVITKNSTPYNQASPLVVTCTGCHASAIQNGPFHWNILVWALAFHSSAVVSWGFNAAAADVYDAASRPLASLKSLREVSSATLVLEPKKPLVIVLQK